jgi:hypothetical protein
MLLFFFAGLTLILLLLILIIKEFVITFSKMAFINKELKKYNPKNRYEIRKLTNSIKQSVTIMKNTQSLEEKLHWCSIIISSYIKLSNYTPEKIRKYIEEEIKSYSKKYEELSKKISESKIKNLPNKSINSKYTNINENKNVDVA